MSWWDRQGHKAPHTRSRSSCCQRAVSVKTHLLQLYDSWPRCSSGESVLKAFRHWKHKCWETIHLKNIAGPKHLQCIDSYTLRAGPHAAPWNNYTLEVYKHQLLYKCKGIRFSVDRGIDARIDSKTDRVWVTNIKWVCNQQSSSGAWSSRENRFICPIKG